MRKIWQGDILGYINKVLEIKLEEMANLVADCVHVPCTKSGLSYIIRGKRNGLKDLDPDLMFATFFADEVRAKSENALNDQLDNLKWYLKDQRGVDLSEFEGKASGYEDFVQTMLRLGLVRKTSPAVGEKLPKIAKMGDGQNVTEHRTQLPPGRPSPTLHGQHFTARKEFCGRNNLLERIQDLLRTEHAVVLSGLGGIGKSCLVNQFVSQHRDEYANVQMIRYGDSIHSFRQLILSLNFDNLPESELEEDAKLQQRKYLLKAMDSSTLLIFDNIDEQPEDMDLFDELRKESRLHIIVTTRLTEGFDSACTVSVDALDKDEQLNLFEMYYKKPVPDDMREGVAKLLDYVDGHTLLIELIARSMDEGELDCKDMMERLGSGEDSEELPDIQFQKDGSQKTKLWRFVRKILFNMEHFSEKQADAMRLLTLLPVDGISRRLLCRKLAPGSTSTLGELEHKSWVIKEIGLSGENLTRLHPVIREAAKDELHPSCENCRSFLEQLCSFMEEDMTPMEAEDLCKLGLSIVDTIDFREDPQPENLQCLLAIARFLRGQNNWKYRYKDLLKLYIHALELWESGDASCFSPQVPIELHIEIGWFFQQLPDYDSAIKQFKIAAELAAGDAVLQARSYRKLGEVCRKASLYEDAIRYNEHALKIFTAGYDIAEVKNAIGVVYLNMGDKEKNHEIAIEYYQKAKEHYQEALELWECCRGTGQPENLEKQLAYANHNIGTSWHKQGDYRKAKAFHEKGLQIREEYRFVEWERDVAASYTWLGNDCMALAEEEKDAGRTSDAEKYMAQAKKYIDLSLETRQKLMGSEHPEYAWALQSLSQWCENTGDIEQAVSIMDEVIRIRQKALGDLHSYTKSAQERKEKLLKKL